MKLLLCSDFKNIGYKYISKFFIQRAQEWNLQQMEKLNIHF